MRNPPSPHSKPKPRLLRENEMAYQSRKVLVTGGAGFIGSHVAEAYLARGDQVWIVDDLSTGKAENIPEGAVFHDMDIAEPHVCNLIRDVGFDVINHHAAQIDVRKSVADPPRDARVNVLGLLNVLEGAREAGVGRVLFASSGSIYAGSPQPRGEEDEKRPISPYAIGKLAGEHYLGFYRETHDLESVVLRYSNVYGPRQDPLRKTGVVSIFCSRIAAGDPVIVFGDGEQTRDYVFVRDVVSANLALTDLLLPKDRSVAGRAFNVSNGTGSTVNEIADQLARVSGVGFGRNHASARAGEVRHNIVSSAKLREACGWAPKTPLADGLKETFHYIAETLAALQRA